MSSSWQVKIEQRVEVLQSHNSWLEEELSAKTEAVQQERCTVAAQVCHTPEFLRWAARPI